MTRQFRLVALPILATLIASVVAAVTLLQKQASAGEPVFTEWTIAIFACSGLSLTVSTLQAVAAYREEQRKAKRARFRVRLQRLGQQPSDIRAWLQDQRAVTGLLSLVVTKNGKAYTVLEHYVRYGELTEPTAPGEREYQQELPEFAYSSADSLKGATITLRFEPDRAQIRSSSIYDREDLHEYALDAPIASDGSRRAIVYSQRMKAEAEAFRQSQEEPDLILRVSTNHRPPFAEVASLFNVIGQARIELNDETLCNLICSEQQLAYDYVLTARIADEYTKRIVHFGSSLQLAL